MQEEFVIKGKKVVEGTGSGQALVSKNAICFLKTISLDGVVIDHHHDLYGQSIVGKVLVYPTGKGSCAASYKLYQLAIDGKSPKCIINIQSDSVTLSGAFLGKIPMIHRLELDPTEAIETGDMVEYNADKGFVKVIKQRNRSVA